MDAPWINNFKNKKSDEDHKQDRINSIEITFEGQVKEDGTADIADLATASGKSEKTIRRWINEHGGFWIEDGKVGKKA